MTDSDKISSRRFRPAVLVVAVAAAILLGAELSARALEPRLPPAVWGDAVTDAKVAQIEKLASTGGVDVVFVGSSMVNVGLDPVAFTASSPWAETAYNASLNGASLQLLEAWATDVVLPELEPEVVVIGVASRSVNDRGANQSRALDRYVTSQGRAEHLDAMTVLERIEATAADAFALVRLRGQLRNPYTVLRDAFASQADTQSHLGYESRLREQSYRVSAGFEERSRNNVLRDYWVSPAELAALDRLVATAVASGAQVYLVDMPVVESDWIPLHPKGADDHHAYRTAIAGFADDERLYTISATGVVADRALFADPLHLNARGADLLVRWLAEQVIAP